MVASKEGLSRVKEICENRAARAKELKSQGKKIIGYLCCFPPLELFTAADLVPYRIFGDMREPITKADIYLEEQMCPFIRSCFDIAFKGRYDFLDGFVAPHSCDVIHFLYRAWKDYFNPAYSHFIQVPHMPDHPTSHDFFKRELDRFKKSIETLIGNPISRERLQEAIELHNQNRGLLRELNELRKEEPPRVSGTEMTQTLIAVMSLPVVEANEVVRQVTNEVKTRQHSSPKKQARVLVYGSQIDDIPFVQLVEESGANVVMDDLSVGTRFYWSDVEITEDLLDGLATRYLEKIMCPRTFREGKPSERFRYILDYAKEFNVKGVILYTHRFCDTHNIDVPDLRDYLREEGLAVIHLEDDYTLTSVEPLRTRAQAFAEVIG